MPTCKRVSRTPVKWATKKLAQVQKQGLLPGEAADYILAEVGRRFNIGAMNAVEKKLDLHPKQPDDEPEDEEFDEDGEEIESMNAKEQVIQMQPDAKVAIWKNKYRIV